MPDSVVAALVFFLDEAFAGSEEHSLLGNLETVSAEDWRASAAGDGRSIRAIAAHAGIAKYLYANHLFGNATLDYEAVLRGSPAVDKNIPIDETVAWLRSGHDALRAWLVTLPDADLATPRRTHWGEMRETRGIISVLIMHDVYHAGEINHLRAIRQNDDRWPWESR